MNTKLFIGGACLLALLGLFSFKANHGQSNSKIILISMLNGFEITYGDGKKETLPFITRPKALAGDSWVDIQLQATLILNEFKEKGYHFAGTHKLMTDVMVLEKD